MSVDYDEKGCDYDRQHTVATVRADHGAAPFAITMDWPIPWKHILPSEVRHVLSCMTDYCLGYADISSRQSSHLHGREVWTIHCHCKNPSSLQCAAAASVFKSLFQECIDGAGFNCKFVFYQRLLSKINTPFLHYIGSMYVRGVHYIYLSNASMEYVDYVSQLDWGEAILWDGWGRNYLILVCRSCKGLGEASVRSCAFRIRRLMLQCFRLLPVDIKRQMWRKRFQHEYKLFENLYRFHDPIPYSAFGQC